MRELNILDSRKTLSDISENSARSLCRKIVMLKKKVKSPFQTRYNCDRIKSSCYSSDKGFKKTGEVNIWRGKREIIFQKNLLIRALLHFRTPFFILIILVLITIIVLSNLGQPQPWKLPIFSRFSGLKVS